MKTQKLNLFVTMMAVTIMSLFVACSTKKNEESKDKTDKMEMQNEKPVERTASAVKVFDNVDASVKSQVNNLFIHYQAMTKALIEDNAEGAKASAKILKDDLAKFDMSKLMGEQMDFYHAQEAKLTKALKGMDESIDLEEIRTEFATLSDSVYALVKAYDANGTEVYYDFCPMAKNNEGAYWLSTVKEINNPYMGQRMPHCGSIQETIN